MGVKGEDEIEGIRPALDFLRDCDLYGNPELKGKVAVQQAQADLDGHDRSADGSHHLQDQGGKKGHAQHAQGCLPELVADLGDRLPVV
jgi:hypothetical protein